MFNEEELSYMKKLGLDILDFSNLSDSELLLIHEMVAYRLEVFGLDEDYNPTREGTICENILNKLP